MLVSHILKSKSDDGVVTVTPGATVAEVAELLSTRRIGAVVVSHDGRVVLGIVSERDVVRELGRRGPACLTDRVESLMTAKADDGRPLPPSAGARKRPDDRPDFDR
jgi:CBS domain-containing protein